MKAAVLREYGATPQYGDLPEPRAGAGQVVVAVAAAALHHFDLLKASGRFYLAPPPLPCAVGTDGIGRLADGRRVYFDESVPPYGSMAERAVVQEHALFDLDEDVDDATAAALGNTSLGAWLALAWRAELQPGETVLVLGATGGVGQIAVQAAKLLGAGRVVAAAPGDDRLTGLLDRGADAIVDLDAGGDLTAAFKEAAGGDLDVTIDMLWGEPALAAMRAVARCARHIQVGQLAGMEISLPAPQIRSVSLDVRGFSVAHPPLSIKREAHRRLVEHVRRGELVVDLERIPLTDVATAWERQRKAAGGAKLVLLPTAA